MTGVLELLRGSGADRTTDATHSLMYPHSDGSWWTKDETGVEVPLAGVPSTRNITGAGLLGGGGSLAADRTITFNAAAANTILANNTGVSAVPSFISPSALKTLLAIANTDVSGLGSLATLSSVDTAQLTNNAVDLTKLSDMTSATFLGQIQGGSGDPVKMTAAQSKTALAITSGDVSGLGTLATVSNLTGNVTSVGGTTTIPAGTITNAMQAAMTANTISGRAFGAGGGDPTDLSIGLAGTATAVLHAGFAPASLVTAGAWTSGTAVQPVRIFTIPANTLAIGDVLELTLTGVLSTSAASTHTWTVRCGAAGSLATANVMAVSTVAPVTGKVNQPFLIRAIVGVRAIGAGGSMLGALELGGQAFQAVPASTVAGTTVAGAVDTSIARDISICIAQLAASSTGTIHSATIRKIVGGV